MSNFKVFTIKTDNQNHLHNRLQETLNEAKKVVEFSQNLISKEDSRRPNDYDIVITMIYIPI